MATIHHQLPSDMILCRLLSAAEAVERFRDAPDFARDYYRYQTRFLRIDAFTKTLGAPHRVDVILLAQEEQAPVALALVARPVDSTPLE